MRRRFVAIALASSLVMLTLSLCSGGIGLLWPDDGFEKEREFTHHALYFQSYQGIFCLVWSSGWPDQSWISSGRSPTPLNPLIVHNLMLFELTNESQTVETNGKRATVHWVGFRSNVLLGPLLPLLIAAGCFWKFRQDVLRWRVGRCRSCRYCLTGNTSGICPECGTPVARNREAVT